MSTTSTAVVISRAEASGIARLRSSRMSPSSSRIMFETPLCQRVWAAAARAAGRGMGGRPDDRVAVSREPGPAAHVRRARSCQRLPVNPQDAVRLQPRSTERGRLMLTLRVLLRIVVSIAGVVVVIGVLVAPSVWLIVPCWAIGAAYTVGQIRTGYADSSSPVPTFLDPPVSGPVGAVLGRRLRARLVPTDDLIKAVPETVVQFGRLHPQAADG